MPLEWYAEHEHIGYRIDGTKLVRKTPQDELDRFLASIDDPNSRRTIYDAINDKQVRACVRVRWCWVSFPFSKKSAANIFSHVHQLTSDFLRFFTVYILTIIPRFRAFIFHILFFVTDFKISPRSARMRSTHRILSPLYLTKISVSPT